MTPKSRSLSGAALALVFIPIFAGLLACMPVPIGDPERSRIDPEMTGVWAVLATGGNVDAAGFYVFDRYDKRTWLVSGAGLEAREDADLSKYELASYDGFVELVAADEKIYIEGVAVYKAWLKKLGGEVFMTWEPKLALDDDSEDGLAVPDVWFVYRVIKDGPDKLQLQMVDSDSDLFDDDIAPTRRAFEKVMRKNADNPELYIAAVDDDPEYFMTLARVQESEMNFFENLLETIVDWE